MEKSNERNLALATALALVGLVADGFVARATHLLALPAVWPFVAVAGLMSAFVWARLRLARRAEEERRDRELAKKDRTASALFAEDEGKFDPFTIGRTHEQFERWFVPAFTALVAVIFGFWSWSLFEKLRMPVATGMSLPLVAASVLAGQAFLLFLFSRFLLGLSRDATRRLMRGPGVALGIACLASLAGAVTALVVEGGYPAADRIAALVLAGLLAALAAEMALNFIWELYRPRKRGELNRSYESRLGGLMTDPATWVKNIGGALDYQFGFKVSDTWLYRFLERALLPLMIFQAVALYALSCLVFLGPEEEGIVERFGKPRAEGWHLQSGFHLKAPWPFENVRRFPVKRVQKVEIGFKEDATGHVDRSVLVWTMPHFKEEDQFLAANPEAGGGTDAVPVNLLSFNVPVEYQISDIRQFAYNCADPTRALAQIAYRSLTLEAATRGLFDVMTEGRLKMAESLRDRIQREADKLELGIKILYVGMEGVHPPTGVADAFESVIGATEESEAAVWQAKADASKVLPVAMADAEKAKLMAEAYAVRRAEISSAEADQYLKRMTAYRQSPGVFRGRLYLSTLQESLRQSRKYIVAMPPGKEIVILDLEEKLSPELFDFSAKPEKK